MVTRAQDTSDLLKNARVFAQRIVFQRGRITDPFGRPIPRFNLIQKIDHCMKVGKPFGVYSFHLMIVNL